MWLYKGTPITSRDQIPSEAIGFVYIITHKPTGIKYVGKKNLETNTKKKLTKKEIQEHSGKGRKPKSKRVIKESNWLDYRGSGQEFLSLVKESPEEDLTKEILCFCGTSKSLTYNELKYQILLAVLEKKEYSNSTILGKFFSKDCEIVEYGV